MTTRKVRRRAAGGGGEGGEGGGRGGGGEGPLASRRSGCASMPGGWALAGAPAALPQPTPVEDPLRRPPPWREHPLRLVELLARPPVPLGVLRIGSPRRPPCGQRDRHGRLVERPAMWHAASCRRQRAPVVLLRPGHRSSLPAAPRLAVVGRRAPFRPLCVCLCSRV